MNSNLSYALITRITAEEAKVPEVLHKLKPKSGLEEYFYLGKKPGEILSVLFSSSPAEILAHLQSPAMKEKEERVAAFLLSDWNRQLIETVETVKSSEVALQNSGYLQLRYIEVPRKVYGEYARWRKETIFKHVKNQEQIESFHAYHTLLSTEPGVMFLSAFSCPEEEYVKCFNNPHYLSIVREAGDRFISGGEKGLYTKIYKRV